MSFPQFCLKFFKYFYFNILQEVNKKLLYLFFIFTVQFFVAQQNEEFRMVKNYYDNQRSNLAEAFKAEMSKQYTDEQKMMIKSDFSEFMLKMDSIQNVAMVGALIRVKNREDLRTSLPNSQSTSLQNEVQSMMEVAAEYPGGIHVLRKEVSELFYFDAVTQDLPKISTSIAFVVERDGSISEVKAAGDHSVFNRQAEIAVYLLANKFSPAKLNGVNVRSRFRIPITMSFE